MNPKERLERNATRGKCGGGQGVEPEDIMPAEQQSGSDLSRSRPNGSDMDELGTQI